MKEPGTLFFIGNQRTGTSLLIEMLNLHPQILLSGDSDIVWALYQLHRGLAPPFSSYQWDSPLELSATLEACDSQFRRLREAPSSMEGIRKAYFDMQLHLMKFGSRIQERSSKKEVSWIGETKPVQTADPVVQGFLGQLFPEAKFIHLIRHPGAVAASAVAASKRQRLAPAFWRAGAEKILERWVVHERWAKKVEEALPESVLRIRVEDLARDVRKYSQVLGAFLGLEFSSDVIAAMEALLEEAPNQKYSDYATGYSDDVKALMEEYGYTDTIA